MIRKPRKLVVKFIEHPNEGPSQDIFPVWTEAVLECGHIMNLGVSADRPKRMACSDCFARAK